MNAVLGEKGSMRPACSLQAGRAYVRRRLCLCGQNVKGCPCHCVADLLVVIPSFTWW